MSSSEETIRKTVAECKAAHHLSPYFARAEPYIEWQWQRIIGPAIANADFHRVLELAPGHGRNTARLLTKATEIHLVDVNQSCIDACKKRFESYTGPCKLFYYVNDGHSLGALKSNSFTFIYSWDSMVHFDKLVVRDYLYEFARVLLPGGTGFIHHSNYGAISDSTDWQSNPQWRSNTSRENFAQYAADAGLRIIQQRIIDWNTDKNLDCISTFEKPKAR